MEHGRDHDERMAKYGRSRPRHSNTPPDPESEAPTAERGPARSSGGHGADPAPTGRAIRHEAARHARERAGGRVAAGTHGRRKAKLP